MSAEIGSLWILVIAATALTAWWLMLRPNASYRGISASASFMIVVLAVLLGILAIHGQSANASPAQPTGPGAVRA